MNRKKKYVTSKATVRDDKKLVRRFLSLSRRRLMRSERLSSSHKIDDLNKFNNALKPLLEI
jgi:hypothetical protein